MKTSSMYARLLRYVKPYWKIFLLSLVSMMVLASTEPAVAALMKPMMDGTFVDRDPSTSLLTLGLLVCAFLVRGISFFGTSAGLGWISSRVVMDLRLKMFEKLVTLPSSYFDRNPAGTTISKFSYNVQQVTTAASNGLLVLVRDTLSILGLVGWMFYLQWKLALIIVVIAPVIVLLLMTVNRRLRRLSHAIQDSMGEITQAVGEAIFANRIMKMYGGQANEIRRFGDAANRVRSFGMKALITDSALKPFVQLLAVLALAVSSYFAMRQTTEGSFTIGDFISFFTAMGLLLPPIRRITGVNRALQQGIAAAESVFGLMDREPEKDRGEKIPREVKGRIEFRDVSFSYEGQAEPTLRGLDFVIEAGQTVALVGASGSGKTTMIHLVSRLYELETGSILLDGEDIRDISLEALRRNIAMVSQDVVLFHDRLRANIAYGELEGATDEEVTAAATAAHAMEFIRELPEGLETVVGDRGALLSAGQRQRVTIARAFLKDAPILVLDEATSALDATSEMHIAEALDRVREGRTTIVIAHRLSTIESADRILVLHDGEIAESGTHEDLLSRSTRYRQLYRTQFSGADS